MVVLRKGIDKRESNFELLRIISIIFIIFHHFVIHSTYDFSLGTANVFNDFLVALFHAGGKFGVVLFVMITGYYMVNKKEIKFKKLFQLEVQVLFYSFFLYLIFVLFMGKEFIKNDLFKYLTPNINWVYWFFSTYFILYLLIPYINKMLLELDKKEYIKLLFIGFIFLILMPTIIISKHDVSAIVYLIYYYMIGAYIKLFGNNIKGKKRYAICFVLSYLAIPVSSLIIRYFSFEDVSLKNYIFMFIHMDSIFIFISSICLFLFFKKFKINYSKTINWLASFSFGVYLVHDHPLVRDFLFKKMYLVSDFINNNSFLFISISIVTGIYISSVLFEIIRKLISKFLCFCYRNLFCRK